MLLIILITKKLLRLSFVMSLNFWCTPIHQTIIPLIQSVKVSIVWFSLIVSRETKWRIYALVNFIGSDNGLSPGRRQAIIWTYVGMLLIGVLWTKLSEIVSEIGTFSFKKMHMKMSSRKWRPFCLGPNALIMSPGRRKRSRNTDNP